MPDRLASVPTAPAAPQPVMAPGEAGLAHPEAWPSYKWPVPVVAGTEAAVRAELVLAGVSDRVRELLRRCLEKDVRRRLRDIGDARIELEDTLSPRAEQELMVDAMRDARFVEIPGCGHLAAVEARTLGEAQPQDTLLPE